MSGVHRESKDIGGSTARAGISGRDTVDAREVQITVVHCYGSLGSRTDDGGKRGAIERDLGELIDVAGSGEGDDGRRGGSGLNGGWRNGGDGRYRIENIQRHRI